jgi:hypothetical protein
MQAREIIYGLTISLDAFRTFYKALLCDDIYSEANLALLEETRLAFDRYLKNILLRNARNRPQERNLKTQIEILSEDFFSTDEKYYSQIILKDILLGAPQIKQMLMDEEIVPTELLSMLEQMHSLNAYEKEKEHKRRAWLLSDSYDLEKIPKVDDTILEIKKEYNLSYDLRFAVKSYQRAIAVVISATKELSSDHLKLVHAQISLYSAHAEKMYREKNYLESMRVFYLAVVQSEKISNLAVMKGNFDDFILAADKLYYQLVRDNKIVSASYYMQLVIRKILQNFPEDQANLTKFRKHLGCCFSVLGVQSSQDISQVIEYFTAAYEELIASPTFLQKQIDLALFNLSTAHQYLGACFIDQHDFWKSMHHYDKAYVQTQKIQTNISPELDLNSIKLAVMNEWISAANLQLMKYVLECSRALAIKILIGIIFRVTDNIHLNDPEIEVDQALLSNYISLINLLEKYAQELFARNFYVESQELAAMKNVILLTAMSEPRQCIEDFAKAVNRLEPYSNDILVELYTQKINSHLDNLLRSLKLKPAHILWGNDKRTKDRNALIAIMPTLEKLTDDKSYERLQEAHQALEIYLRNHNESCYRKDLSGILKGIVNLIVPEPELEVLEAPQAPKIQYRRLG